MYRFLLTPRWLGILALTLVAATVMVLLGNWQLSRYQTRSAINDQIDAATHQTPTPLTETLPGPGSAPGTTGQAPQKATEWGRVTVTGRYDSDNTILVRGRTVNSRVGFEVVTPLVLADGSAVLVNRGWVPPASGDAMAQPEVPAAPTGQVTVVGRVHMSESRPDTPQRRNGYIETRRIAVPRLTAELPYSTYGAYLLLDEQDPPADPVFSAIPIKHENNWQNAGYVIQWWLFALMTLVGFGWLARREAHGPPDRSTATEDRLGEPTPTSPA
ncbi:SURF1 family cytochrome oxidase biogenesis protein [Micromonospora sp. NPDC003197]